MFCNYHMLALDKNQILKKENDDIKVEHTMWSSKVKPGMYMCTPLYEDPNHSKYVPIAVYQFSQMIHCNNHDLIWTFFQNNIIESQINHIFLIKSKFPQNGTLIKWIQAINFNPCSMHTRPKYPLIGITLTIGSDTWKTWLNCVIFFFHLGLHAGWHN